MLHTVKAEITLSSSNLKLLESVRAALSPDNKLTPPGMLIEDGIWKEDGEFSYSIRVYLSGENLVALLLRARSTTEEVLSIINLLLRQLKTSSEY